MGERSVVRGTHVQQVVIFQEERPVASIEGGSGGFRRDNGRIAIVGFAFLLFGAFCIECEGCECIERERLAAAHGRIRLVEDAVCPLVR